MGLISWISGGGETAKKVVDAAINTGDALFFTDEEKSQASQKRLDWVLKYMSATNAQNVARRLIAVMVVGIWAFILAIAVIAGYFSRDEGSYAVWLFGVLKDVVANPYNIIMAFYFLTGTVRAFKGDGSK